MPDQDYYAVLGVARNASDEDIRRAFRRKLWNLTRDRTKNADAEDKFKESTRPYQSCPTRKNAPVYRFGRCGAASGAQGGGQSFRRLRRIRRLGDILIPSSVIPPRPPPANPGAAGDISSRLSSVSKINSVPKGKRAKSPGALQPLLRGRQRTRHLRRHLFHLPWHRTDSPLPAQRFRPVHPGRGLFHLRRTRQRYRQSLLQLPWCRPRAPQAQDRSSHPRRRGRRNAGQAQR